MKRFTFAITSLIFLVVAGIESASAQHHSRPVPYRPGYGHSGYIERPAAYSNSYYNDNSSYVRYKGFLEVGYGAGVSTYKASQLDILTTHGGAFGNFFIGLGTGVNILFPDDKNLMNSDNWNSSNHYNNYKERAVFIPLYLDMKYNFGNTRTIAPFVDVKLGATFLASDDEVYINDGWMDGRTCLMFSPTIGLRVPLGNTAAFNFGVTYNLISQKYFYYDYWDGPIYSDGIAIHSLGCRFSIEW